MSTRQPHTHTVAIGDPLNGLFRGSSEDPSFSSRCHSVTCHITIANGERELVQEDAAPLQASKMRLSSGRQRGWIFRTALSTVTFALLISNWSVPASSDILSQILGPTCIAEQEIDEFTDELSASLSCWAHDPYRIVLVLCKQPETHPDFPGEMETALFIIFPTDQRVNFGQNYPLEFRVGRSPPKEISVIGGGESNTAQGWDPTFPNALTTALRERQRFAWRFNSGSTAFIKPLPDDTKVAMAFDTYCRQVRQQ